MAHSRVLNSACRGDNTRLLANEPNIVIPSSFSITKPPPYLASSSFQDASNLQNGRIDGESCVTGKGVLSSTSRFSGNTCARLQLSASEVADWRISNGVESLPSKTLPFRDFHMNHMIHEILANTSSGMSCFLILSRR